MKTRIILLLSVVLFVCSPLAGQIKVSSSNNVGIGSISSPDPYQIYIMNGDYKIMSGGLSSGYITGTNIFRLFTNAGQNFSIGAYTSNSTPGSQLITRIGINYAISGANSTSQYSVKGSKYAPMQEFNAENGSISMYGESGTGSDWRTPTYNIGININSTGRVGIKTSANSSYSLYVNGDACCYGGSWQSSDIRVKKNITSLDKSNTKLLLQLNAASYQMIDPSKLEGEGTVSNDSVKSSTASVTDEDLETRLNFGFIAQDLEKVFPNLVKTDEKGYKAVNYTGLIPVIIETLKEQDSIINAQDTRIKQLDSTVTELQKVLVKLQGYIQGDPEQEAALTTNTPKTSVKGSGYLVQGSVPPGTSYKETAYRNTTAVNSLKLSSLK